MSDDQAEALQDCSDGLLVVGIGASAGGIEAISELLRHLPTDFGTAYVIVQHLSPDQPSLLSEVLGRTTMISVTEVEDGTVIECDRIYVIPANTQMTVANGQLRLVERDRTQRLFMPIDTFFRSLAIAYGNQAIGVVLSGLDGDGTQGVREIKGAGGITFAQTGTSAQYSDMPNSAVATGQVDLVLPPAQIAAELAKISRHPYLRNSAFLASEAESSVEGSRQNEEALSTIFSLLRTATGADFRYYKRTTFERRLRRRMALQKLYRLEDYIQYLQENTHEINALYQDVLITVTRFFRDPEVFEGLKEALFPALLQDKTVDSTIRIWVPGCATGEECYSLALCLFSFLANQPVKPAIQIFGTDLNEEIIEKARTGIYPSSAIADVPEQYHHFFGGTEGHYQISKAVRELCIFARQDLISDPPFSNIDLVSCRNVLIYFTRPLQKRVLSIFHYSLSPGKFLILGSAESVGDASNLFTVVNKEYRFHQRKFCPPNLSLELADDDFRFSTLNAAPTQPVEERQERVSVQSQADQIILNRYAPAGVVVSKALDILQFRGDTSPYLRPAAGTPSFNLLKMLRPSLLQETRQAIAQAQEQTVAVKRTGLQVEQDSSQRISVEVLPLQQLPNQERSYLLLFEQESALSVLPPELSPAEVNRDPSDLALELAQVRQELATARQALQDNQLYLQAIVEDQESTNQRFTVANEEILSSNEELQSTNEELQTAKEEIQATNEELKTTNQELQSRNIEARQVNDDLLNLLSNVNLPILMLSSDLCIRRFTPSAQTLFNLIPTDEGRPLNNIRLQLDIDASHLEALILEVMHTLQPQQQEVQDTHGHWHLLRIRPYRTVDDRIDGAVLVLVDIHNLKHTLMQLDQSRQNAESLVESMPIPLLVLEANLQIQTANRAFYKMFEQSRPEIEGQSLFDIGEGEWETPQLRSLLEEILHSSSQIDRLELESVSNRILLLNAREIAPNGEGRLILLAIEDITDSKRAEAERLQAVQEQAELAAAQNASKDEFLSMLSHELRTPLNSIMGWLHILLHQQPDPALLRRGLEVIEHSAQAQLHLIQELLDTTLIIQNRLRLDKAAVDLTQVIQGVIEVMLPLADSQQVQLIPHLPAAPSYFLLDPDRIEQVVWNLIANAIKFTPEQGQVEVRLTYHPDQAQIQITDTGKGIAPEFLPQVFDCFQQASRSTTRQHGGLGLGMAIARSLVELHQGTITVQSPGIGLGTTFVVTLPLIDAEAPSPEQQSDARPAGNLAGIQILIVDDDVDGREMLEILFAQVHQAKVVIADSVATAMSQFTVCPPDLLISDISMPGQDGFELIQWVRSHPPEQGGNVGAIALTGHASENDTATFLAAGFQAHVAKPVQFDELVAIALNLISTRVN